jgi:hypothetical protein
MSLRLLKAAAEAEVRDELHLSRLLVLLGSADARKATPATKARAIEGITKLAKMDFLLRYPTCLEAALEALDLDPALAGVNARERVSIETKMIRFRYGPWDTRYRRWLGLLAAKGLIVLGVQGATVLIGLTERGRAVAEQISDEEIFRDIKARSDLICTFIGQMSGSKLKDFIYATFPGISSMRWGNKIDIDATIFDGTA